MMNDDDAVRGEVHIELETVRTGGHADVERRDCVLRTKVASAAVGKHLRLRR